jgi:RNA-directed DNA polymerase
MVGGFVLKIDIQAFFDTLDHSHLRAMLDKRVRDGVIRRAIDKWLAAGVMEEGRIERPDIGTPQGGVVSPILSNIFFHEVLDRWFAEVVKPRLSGAAALIRFADDAVIAFSSERNARRVMAVLPKRFGRYGLSLHPEKTKLITFKHPHWWGYTDGEGQRRQPETFDLLGFTHYWARTRGSGRWIIKWRTARKRFSRSLKAVADWCKWNRHMSIPNQHRMLVLKLRGHYQYFGVAGNGQALNRFYHEVRRVWRKWLDRRSNRRSLFWDRYLLLLQRYPLPTPAVRRSR